MIIFRIITHIVHKMKVIYGINYVHAQRVKVVYSRATQKSSQSYNATQNT